MAELYDVQWNHAATCLVESPTSGNRVARTFLQPRTRGELESVTAAMRVSARHTHGMMGRAPD